MPAERCDDVQSLPIPTVVLTGVAGSGKTTIGRELAVRWGVELVDADDFHSEAARQRMREGRPLTESERQEWLSRLLDSVADRPPVVLACSALRRRHRDRLRELPGVRIVILDVPEPELRRRLASRAGHFFPAGLLDSQLATWEPPDACERVAVIPGDEDVPTTVDRIADALHLPVSPGEFDGA